MPKKTKNNYLTNIKTMLSNFIRVNKMVWNDKKWFMIGMFFVIIFISSLPYLQSGANALLINYLVVIAEGVSNIDNNVYFLIALVVISYVSNPIAFSIQTNMMQMFWFYLDKKFQVDISRKVSNLDIAIHENPKYKDLINKVQEGGNFRIQNFVERQFFLSQSVFSVIISSGILIYSQWWVFALIIVGTIPELVNELKYGIKVWEIWGAKAEFRRRYFDIRWRFYQVNSLIEMKLFQNNEHFVQIYQDLFSDFQDEEIKNTRIRYKLEMLAIFVSQLTFSIALIYYILEVINGNIEIGTMTFLIASIGSLRGSISNLFMGFARQYQDNLFVTDIFTLMDLKEVIKKPKNGYSLPAQAPKIEFKKVSFKYPGTDEYVLRNFSLVIKPGEKIAIIGVNGAGKTTLIKLLCRFYDPDEGQILINGINLKDINLDSWYNLLGALFQDYERYYFLVKEVISLGRTDQKQSSLLAIKKAAKDSEANAFIEEWDKKYSQMLGKQFTKGVEPSVGQWQKISLARTFYRNPKVLILDEPTASIDAEAEAKIFNKLHKSSSKRTLILISHRFSTVRNADKICVIEDGKMTEFGTHQELVKNNKTYNRLFKLQAKGYK